MAQAKTHFHRDGHIVCPRTSGRSTDSPFSVTCLNCKSHPAFTKAADAAIAARTAAFDAQVPRTFAEPWIDGEIECRNCKGRLFREGNRTCMGHYENYVCADCGETESRLTETGRCF